MSSELDTINDKSFKNLLQPMKLTGFNDEKFTGNKDYDQLSICLYFIEKINENFAGSIVTPTSSKGVEDYYVHNNKIYNFNSGDLAVLLKVSRRNSTNKIRASKNFTISCGIESTLLIKDKICKHHNNIAIYPSDYTADLICNVGYYIVKNGD